MITETKPGLEALEKENISLKNELSFCNQQLDWFKRQIFGKRSERELSSCNEKQLSFDGFDLLAPSKKEEGKQVKTHTRKKPNRNGQDAITLSPDLPVETVILDIPEEEKKSLVKIGEEVSHKLAHKPGSYYIKEIIRPKYADPQKEEAGITIQSLRESIIPRCRADESFLAEIVVKKFNDHLPLNRISEIVGRDGVGISRKLLSQWVVRLGLACEPLVKVMYQKILEADALFIDEIPVKMQNPGKCKQAYMWVVAGGGGAIPPYKIYRFKDNRRHENAFELLEDYHGYVHSDKYGAYEVLAAKKEIIWCPCWAHIRRKFFESQTDPVFRKWVLRKIRYLFMLDKIGWQRSAEERLQIRQEKQVPIIDELIEAIRNKLSEGKIVPKSNMRKALGYFCGLIPYLKNYTKHPFARLDNNIAERSVRPLAIGRKNWLFVGSPDGGRAAAALFSLVQTCRGLGINPREYLEDIFRRLMEHSFCKLEELLPDQWVLRK